MTTTDGTTRNRMTTTDAGGDDARASAARAARTMSAVRQRQTLELLVVAVVLGTVA